MIKHIVMMKLKASEDVEMRKEKLASMLEGLKGKILQIREWEVGRNFSDKEAAFDIVLLSGFDSIEDLDIYRVHPDHVNVLGFIREVVEKIHVVDYVISGQ
jgi:hypothetical protein